MRISQPVEIVEKWLSQYKQVSKQKKFGHQRKNHYSEILPKSFLLKKKNKIIEATESKPSSLNIFLKNLLFIN